MEEEKQVNANAVHYAGSTEGVQQVVCTLYATQINCALGDAMGTGRIHLDVPKVVCTHTDDLQQVITTKNDVKEALRIDMDRP